MKAFDTDILTLITQGDKECLLKAAMIPLREQGIPVVVAEQLLRGRLNMVRQAQSGKSKISIDRAHQLLELSIVGIHKLTILSHTSPAEALMQSWRK